MFESLHLSELCTLTIAFWLLLFLLYVVFQKWPNLFFVRT